jgi:hypothetical protein
MMVFFSCVKVRASSELTSNNLYRATVVDLINKERTNKGLSQLVIDEDLCKVAALIADDRESAYPNKINTSALINPKYKNYVKDYSKVEQLELSYNDILINLYKRTKSPISFSDNNLVKTFTEQNGLGYNALDPKLSNGCVAVSSGQVGYKPFAYFIGGVKKTAMDKFPLSLVKLFLIKIGVIKLN